MRELYLPPVNLTDARKYKKFTSPARKFVRFSESIRNLRPLPVNLLDSPKIFGNNATYHTATHPLFTIWGDAGDYKGADVLLERLSRGVAHGLQLAGVAMETGFVMNLRKLAVRMAFPDIDRAAG